MLKTHALNVTILRRTNVHIHIYTEKKKESSSADVPQNGTGSKKTNEFSSISNKSKISNGPKLSSDPGPLIWTYIVSFGRLFGV